LNSSWSLERSVTPVRKIREVLRLKNEGFSNQAIARVCKVSNSTVGEYLEQATKAGLGWPLPDNLGETVLYERLFPEKSTSSQPGALRAPGWEDVLRELSKRGVSLRLLWQEYREKNPDGYGKTQFGEYYQRWNQSPTNTMRLPHKGGEEMEVDYAGMTVPITNPETGDHAGTGLCGGIASEQLHVCRGPAVAGVGALALWSCTLI
jgi:hypothetical protein